jgi:cysteine desulfurase
MHQPEGKIYFDYAASTPVDPRVYEAMMPYFGEKFGNPSSLHSLGQEAIAAVDRARETVANAIGAEFRDVIFTGSATEANNLALRGSIRGFTRMSTQINAEGVGVSPRPVRDSLRPKLIVSAIEHESVLEAARDLEQEGIEVVYLPVDQEGAVDLEALRKALDERTVLVSVMYANNEIGTIEPISEIAKLIGDFRAQIANRKAESGSDLQFALGTLPLFHTDAAQAFQFLDCDVRKLGVDLMTLSGHKIYGPKGVGAFYIRRPLKAKSYNLKAVITGGGQEFGLRSGTENVPSIVGFARAAELASERRSGERTRLGELKAYFLQKVKQIYPRVEVNGFATTANRKSPACLRVAEGKSGRQIANRDDRRFALSAVPNIMNLYFPDYLAQDLLLRFDQAGVAVSAGAACSTRAPEPSYVVTALGYEKERARRSIRLSFGRPTTKEEIDEAVVRIRMIFAKNSKAQSA